MTERSYPDPVVSIDTVSVESFYDRLVADESISILDVRDREAVEAWRLEGPGITHVHVPYIRFVGAGVNDAVAKRFEETGLTPPVIVVCARGESSAYVASLLAEAGIEAGNLDGGMEAWADYHTVARVPTDTVGVEIRQIIRPASGCVSYVVAAGDDAAVIDPLRAFDSVYSDVIEDLGATLRYALDTHVHADHVSGLADLAAAENVTGILPAGAMDRGYVGPAVTTVEDNDALELGPTALVAVAAPGHTSELTAFRVADVFFGGDSLFLHGVGRPDLEAGAAGAAELAATLYETLHDRLAGIPDGVTVAPGHVDTATLPPDGAPAVADFGTLRDRLGAFGQDRDAFVAAVIEDVPPRPANYEAIIDINLGRRDVDVETAATLELGPNNCAVSAAE